MCPIKWHLCDVAKSIYGAGTDLADQWAQDRHAELDAGQLRALVAALRTQTETTPEVRKCIHYVCGNRHRMRYPQFRAKGLCVASGVVEAGCKQIGARLKRAGMRWTVAGANAIIALRCCLLSGFTDHVFAACSILGYTFVPRIRDLPSKRLYVFERAGVPKQLRPLVGGKVNADLIDRNWADILRVAATMAAGTMRPSQILRKLAAYPRQNELAAALREVGRVERSLFMIDWTTDPDMRRRAQVGLNNRRAPYGFPAHAGKPVGRKPAS